MIEALRAVIKRLHYPPEVVLTCVRWYVADLVADRLVGAGRRAE